MTATASYADPVERLRAMRTVPRGKCHPGWFYCPVCQCRKSGHLDEPNGRDEGCMDETCLCHREARCTCCDGHDGLGIWHFANPAKLRAWLAGPDREERCELTIECVPGEPWALEFFAAVDAEAWLDAFYERERAEAACERVYMDGRR